IVKKSAVGLMVLAFAVGSFGFSSNQLAPVAHAATTWNTTGNYVINQNYLGTDYPQDLSLVQDSSNNLTGNGGSPAGSNVYTWTITSGTVVNDTIDFYADYTATPDAVTPQTTLHMTGTIAANGTISGTWSDNYQGGTRAGTFSTVSGAATTSSTQKVTTNPATSITSTNATLNGTNGNNVALGHSFWASLNTFSTASTTIPAGVYSTSDMGPLTANDTFSASLSSTGITVTPSTTYYFSAWSNVGGTWYPGAVLSFTTPPTGVQGNGTLQVTSIEMVSSTAKANNSFEDGWKYVFNITVPENETDISMKFANWLKTGGTETIAAGNNMRISSAQANNGGATILITGANTYSTPKLTMVTDLNPSLAGIQVKVVVEVKIPTGTSTGSYTTTYGVKSE
ncbi:MAG TPA: hypothetical protein VFQ59_02300, partial [Candidatus Paceibacterota bacterium]|nr:hypothetical protein [Candidatus Paceibacterota bacterium]